MNVLSTKNFDHKRGLVGWENTYIGGRTCFAVAIVLLAFNRFSKLNFIHKVRQLRFELIQSGHSSSREKSNPLKIATPR